MEHRANRANVVERFREALSRDKTRSQVFDISDLGRLGMLSETVRTRGVTGVEMEALTAATVAALTLYDMIKAVDKLAEIDRVRVLAKTGGKSGDWARTGEDGA